MLTHCPKCKTLIRINKKCLFGNTFKCPRCATKLKFVPKKDRIKDKDAPAILVNEKGGSLFKLHKTKFLIFAIICVLLVIVLIEMKNDWIC